MSKRLIMTMYPMIINMHCIKLIRAVILRIIGSTKTLHFNVMEVSNKRLCKLKLRHMIDDKLERKTP